MYLWHATADAARAELAEILADEPQWTGQLTVVVVDFAAAEPTTRRRLSQVLLSRSLLIIVRAMV